MNESPWMTMDEAAAYLKYRTENASTVVRQMLIRAGFPLYRRNGKSYLVRREDLDEWVETNDCIRGRQRQLERLRESAAAKARFNPPVLNRPRRGRPPKVREPKAITELEAAEQQTEDQNAVVTE